MTGRINWFEVVDEFRRIFKQCDAENDKQKYHFDSYTPADPTQKKISIDGGSRDADTSVWGDLLLLDAVICGELPLSIHSNVFNGTFLDLSLNQIRIKLS